MSDVQIDNLDSILRDPMNADFSTFDGAASEHALSINEERGAVTTAPESEKLDEKPTGATSDASAKGTEATKDAAPKDEDIQPGAVIKTRDGKHEIPFDVLQRTRDRNKVLEAQLAELNAKVTTTQAATEGTQSPDTRSVEDIISPEELAQLKEDAPILASTFEKLIAKINSFGQKAEQSERREQDEVAQRVQSAIDSIPKLVFVQSSDPATFDAIVKVDDFLRSDPQFVGIPLEDRFAKAVSMYEAAHGAINLPASASGKEKAATDAQAKADAAIKQAMESTAPNTLTDLPGGNPPPKDELEAVSGMSAVALTNHLMGMDQQGMEKFLAKFG